MRYLAMTMLVAVLACGGEAPGEDAGAEEERPSLREEGLRSDGAIFAAQAFREIAAGDYKQAGIAARHGVTADPTNPTAQHALAWAAIHEGQKTVQVVAALEAVRLAPDSARFRRTLGIAMAGAGRPRDAVRAFGEAVRLNPSDTLSWRDLARTAYTTRDWALADSAYGRLAELDPAHFDSADAAERAEARRLSP